MNALTFSLVNQRINDSMELKRKRKVKKKKKRSTFEGNI